MRLLSPTLTSRSVITGALFALLILQQTTVFAESDKDNHPQQGEWVVDPDNPGPSLPPVGRSLFDFLITSEETDGVRVYDIPFPYDRLITRLERQLRPSSSEMPAVKQVLIPLGRSLARNIARPDFFRYPRVVAAVDSAPLNTNNHAGILYKDRLYIGYGEKANILEVISYNEAAARFEFQIVTDYKEGGKFKVYYANREVCNACHQNGALIFSRQQWDETNANPKIASLLKQQQRDYFGIPIERGVDIPNAIDDATNRANYFALYQTLWQQACTAIDDNDTDTQNAIHCRADILRYILQYRLSADSVFDNNNDYYQKQFLTGFTQNINQHWPDGLLIPDPDIPNRDPLLMLAKNSQLTEVDGKFTSDASQILNTMLATNDVPSEFEPLNPRPPLTNWRADNDSIESFIRGLSDFLAITDIETLDRHLKLKAVIKKQVKARHELSCLTSQSTTDQDTQRIKFECHSTIAEGTQANPKDTIELKGRFYTHKDEFIDGKLSQMHIAGVQFIDLTLDTQQILSTASGHSASFSLLNGTLNARLPDGNSLNKLVLHWQANSKSTDDVVTDAQLTILDDFAFVTDAINAMETDTLHGDDTSLSGKPFRRASIMAALSTHLILPGTQWCCLNDAGMPPAELDKPDNASTIIAQAAKPELSPFYHYCSLCHRTNQPMPPNFLQGDLTTVENNIAHCAERIFYRLSMWQFDEGTRSKSPMPPFTALEGLGMTYERWKTSDELSQLKHYVSKILQQQTGKAPDINEYVSKGFDNLRNCLP